MNDEAISNRMLWSSARDDLVMAVVSLGFPAELGEAAARHLGSPRAIERMTVYLHDAKPTDAAVLVDEMLAIRAEIDAWKEKKAGIQANVEYNKLLYYGLDDRDESDNY